MEKNFLVAIGAVAAAAALVFCLIVFMPLQTPQCIGASGPIVTKSIPVESFTKIEASGQIELYLKQDNLESVAIEAQESIAGLVFAEVQNGALIIGLRNFGQPGTGRPCLNGQTKIKVFVSAPGIDSIKAGDFAKVFTEGRIYREQLLLEASGSALIDANISVDDLNSFASSFGTIILAGFAERHSANVITGGRIIAGKLETMHGFFEAFDNGSINATVFEEISATAKTGGSIGFGGGATISRKVTESGGTITETTGSGSDEGGSGIDGGTGTSGEVPEGDGSGDGDLPDEGAPPAGGGDEEPPADGGGEEPEQAVCGNGLIEIQEECELDSGCAIGKECSGCECVDIAGQPSGGISFAECTSQGGDVLCGEGPSCPPDVKKAGGIEGSQECICCVYD
ncbi:MAG: DUF2807 domain-containing protein [archaeon]